LLLIEVVGLTKRYGSHTAVNNISFRAEAGEILGFLGSNGAGKTTTLNMLTGYLSASEGEIIINGYNMFDEPEEAKKQLGYLPDTPPVYLDMLVDEYLNFAADLKKIPKYERKEMLEEIKRTVQIKEESRRMIRNLSKGYRQRVGLAQALIGDPPVIIMDEPMTGLDPMQIIEIRDLIKSLGKKHTVLLSSHILSEVSAVCDRVMIINKGSIAASDTPERLAAGFVHSHTMLARIRGSREAVEAALSKVAFLESFDFEPSREEGTQEVVVKGEEDADIREGLFYSLADAKLPLLMLKSNDMSLEEIFLQVTGQDKLDSEGGGDAR